MGFPSTGNEGIFRNHAEHVTEFLRVKHADKVKVYNLCSERDYPVSLFDGRVAKYPFDDHNPPPIQMFLPFCEDVKLWLDSDPENVVAIHCKAGKGRTGVMICAYLLYIGEWVDADYCMAFYGCARTHNGKGVTIPSQKRFIRHFGALCAGIDMKADLNSSSEAVQYPAGVLKFADKTKLANIDATSGSDEDSEGDSRVVSQAVSTNTSMISTDTDTVTLGDDREDTVDSRGGGLDDVLMMEVNTKETSAAVNRSVVVTSKGTVFKDYSATGSQLEENLNKARTAANSSKVGRRPTYAQASFWMSSHQETVHQIFLDSGVPGGLLGSDELDGGDVVLALEDVKPEEQTESSSEVLRVRGQVLPAVVLAVVEMRLSSVPVLNLMGSFQPIFRIQGAGYDILSSDFLPQSTYRGKGAITFAIPGINVVDEVLFTIYNKTNFGKDKIGAFWLHTAFITDHRVVLKKLEIDKVNKDKRHKKYPSDFTIEIIFEEVLFEVDEFDGVHEEQV